MKMAGELGVPSTCLLSGELVEDEHCDPYTLLNQRWRSGSGEREGRDVKDLLLSFFLQNRILSGPAATMCLSRDVLQPPSIFLPLALLLYRDISCS